MKSLFTIIIVITLVSVVWFIKQTNNSPQVVKETSFPVISREDILNATDLKAGVKLAVQQVNDQAISEWLEKASDLAEEAGLPAEDISYLQSNLAKKFVVFQAKRSLFNDAVEQAYYAIEDITPIKEQYPEAQDLFVKVDALLKKRNKLIEQIAKELAGDKPVDDEFLQAAQQQWKQQVANRQKQ
ncbi:hypothetical protein [Paraglaciecola sp. L3A3]|uniref:hypothetical protein n=1 Tax=Paraglaciecola sp. L3A3 TaxID=2686358 RepID=UPI00131D1D08|nr:hypothetical protein [Paraglaciecola sp. L3A3]